MPLGKGQQLVPISAVWLRREGNKAVVLLEIGGAFRRVIVEGIDGPFSHICESVGILSAPWEPVAPFVPDGSEVT